jgi:hypothetical protein
MKFALRRRSYKLCERCQKLDLRLARFLTACGPDTKFGYDYPPNKVQTQELGTLQEVRSRHWCVLCNLAARCYADHLKPQRDPFAHDDPAYRDPTTPVSVFLGYMHKYFDSDLQQERRGLVLGFTDIGTFFSPLARDASKAGFKSEQYFTRHSQHVSEKGALVKKWVDLCQKEHGTKCVWPTGCQMDTQNIERFIIIDVLASCIVDAPKDCQYACLSYVWGSTPFLTLTTENEAQLRTPGILVSSTITLPKTIKDAIELVRHSSVRFVWIDALCIIQNHGSHKQDAIRSMAQIYGAALFTIINIEGTSAHSGLWRPGSHEARLSAKIAPGFTLSSFEIYRAWGWNWESTWTHTERAWT